MSASRKKQKRAVETLKHMSRAECHHEMNRLRLLAESRGFFQNRSNFSEWDRFFSERGKFLKDSEPPPRDLERELMYAVRDLRSGRTTPAVKGGSGSQRIDGESNR